MSTTEAQSTLALMSGDTVLFEHTEGFTTKSYLSVYFPTPLFLGIGRKPMLQALLSDQFARHKLALGQYIASGRAMYEQAVAVGTVSGYREFAKNNPDSFFRMESLARLAELEPQRNALAFHRDNLNADPAYLAYLPDRYDIWFIGPEDMHVYEVLRLSRTEEEILLATRIKAAGQPYKVFNGEEIALLKEGGLSSTLIAAMIEVSGQASGVRGVPRAIAVPVASAAPSALEVPAKPEAGDVAAQCTKRLLAMKACSQIPSFGANICRGQVAKKYSHVACSFIN